MSQTQEELFQGVAGEVRAWMARRQFTGRSVAQQLGWSEIALSRRLTGKVAFDVAELMKIASLLDVHVSAFFEAPTGLGVRKQDNRPPIRRLASAA